MSFHTERKVRPTLKPAKQCHDVIGKYLKDLKMDTSNEKQLIPEIFLQLYGYFTDAD